MKIKNNKFVKALFLFVLSIVAGITGYSILEHYSLADAFYMSVITISTVGYGEVNSLSDNGKLFTSFYILFNLGIFAYVVSVITSVMVEGNLRIVFRNFFNSNEVKQFRNHTIICGFGRNGQSAFTELMQEGNEIVIIEADDDVIPMEFQNEKMQRLIGDATTDEVLNEAGVERASAIITTLPSDADNVYITLSAKEVNPNIKVIARAADNSSEKKLYRAGATHVVMPDKLGGIHMAQLIAKPYVIEFLELLSGVDGENIKLDEINLSEIKEEFHHKTLAELNIRKNSGVSVIGLKRDEQGFQFNPDPSTVIHLGDVLIIMGTSRDIRAFSNYYC